ncbi:MAG TPA: helix-turn-helix domain-containing GNAT family N-acetyltransferase [Gemmatimonadales bacterium]|jgi:DNA-binding MarR family transcriptional regulator/GNAT superfamily N-acetyltransferase|nr:helix-turn-helix domain-containing GNAT family N-acetyltransferase [Gemmatimonadales bacterium]
MADLDFQQRVAAVRRFNRFYTRQIGLLQEHLLHSPFSLTEARVLYELAHHVETTATSLGAGLGLDAGYLSRILRAFQKRGLIQKERSKTDGRQTLLRLSPRGQDAFAKLNADSHQEIGIMLRALPGDAQARLLDAMQGIESLLGAPPERAAPYTLRPHRPGDMGWVVERHGALYEQEYGWDATFEALVAEIVARFIRRFDPRRERCWIAEKDGANVGSVFLVKKAPTVGQLRLLLVEPSARGLGIGRRLVDECTRFARQVGYRKIVLWTNSVLHAARRIYEQAGYRLTAEESHHSFGHDLVGQTWELTL